MGVAASLIVILAVLFWERRCIRAFRHSIPLRVAVTGTRGKTTVVRLIAAVLAGSGLRVVAKTTGTTPLILLPDGQEMEFTRRGRPSILEGKRLLKAAACLEANTLVGEMMSIQPETLFVESHQILDPRILVITNVRRDHIHSLGRTTQDIARSYAAAIPEDGILICPEEEYYPVFEREARRRGSRVVRVPRDFLYRWEKETGKLSGADFPSNVRLALAVADFFRIDPRTAWKAVLASRSDPAALRISSIKIESFPHTLYTVSAFSANDPDSTKLVLSQLYRISPFQKIPWVGILNLRADRGDRTLQWLEAFEAGMFPELRKLVVTGPHAAAVERRLRKRFEPSSIFATGDKDPSRLMNLLFEISEGETAVLGMGNMDGMGQRICSHWEEVGERHDP